MRFRELGLMVALVLLFIGGFAMGAKGESWGFRYEHGRPQRHYPHGHHQRYCPYEDHYYRYHYQPYYGYGWEYRRPCPPPRHHYRPRGYYGFYYER